MPLWSKGEEMGKCYCPKCNKETDHVYVGLGKFYFMSSYPKPKIKCKVCGKKHKMKEKLLKTIE